MTKAIGHFESLGMFREITGQRRGRRYGYSDYLDIPSLGTDQLPR